jgi:hypothetical protein
MAKPARPWTVLPHGPIEKLDDNLWTVAGDLPGVSVKEIRRMSIVRRSDGSLLFFHAIPLDETTLAEVRTRGQPAVLVIPHDQHAVDARAFAEKLGLRVFGPMLNETKLRERVSLAGTLDQLEADPCVAFESLEGTKTGEPVGIVRSGERVSLLFADAVQAIPKEMLPVVFRLFGMGGGPKVTPPFKFLFMTDKKALRAHLERLAALPGLVRLIPCHGILTTSDAAETLKRVAAAM